MKGTTRRALISLIVISGPAMPASADFALYSVQSYPAYQTSQGQTYTVAALIETDGNTGVLAASDIVFYSYQIFLGSTVVASGNSSIFFAPAGSGFVASGNELLINPASGTTTGGFLTLLSADSDIGWSRSRSGSIITDQYFAFSSSQNKFLWNDTVPYPPGLSLPSPSAPWIIATQVLPEPGSLTLAVLACAFLATVYLLRRGRRLVSGPGGHTTVMPSR
jgi:hypothetical protein